MFLWFYGGFVVAAGLLLLATLVRLSHGLREWCVVGAFCGPVYEAGCSTAASAFGRPTGNGGGDNTMDRIVAVAFVPALIWCILIALRWRRKG